MKTKLLASTALALIFASSLLGSPTTITGVLTDDMCTKKHMMPGKPNADCVRECIKHGAKYVVVSEGKVLEVTGNQDKLNEFAGRKVKVAGEAKGRTIVVASIEAAQ